MCNVEKIKVYSLEIFISYIYFSIALHLFYTNYRFIAFQSSVCYFTNVLFKRIIERRLFRNKINRKSRSHQRQPSSHKGSVLRPTRHLLPYKLFHIVIYINVTHVRELRKLPVHVTVMYDPA